MSDPVMEFPREMGAQDAMLWRMEKEPLFRSTLLAVTLLERPPDREHFLRNAACMAQELPRLRQRIVPMPELVSTPIWAYADDFDLGYHVRFLRGMHPKVIACSHHMGHWEHGVVARADSKFNANKGEFSNEGELPADRDLPGGVWWSRDNGGPGGGVHLNDALPINPAPLVGGQNWFDNVCTVEKIRT